MLWRHSLSACAAQAGGFNVHCGPRIQPGEEEAIDNLARHIIRASFSQERVTYVPDESKVIYQSKFAPRNAQKDLAEKLLDAIHYGICSPQIQRRLLVEETV
jgi:hypothetical protein